MIGQKGINGLLVSFGDIRVNETAKIYRASPRNRKERRQAKKHKKGLQKSERGFVK